MYKLKKYFIFFVSMICSAQLYANSVTINVNPVSPVINEEFEVFFNVTTGSGSSQPYISFNPSNAEVRGRKFIGRQSNARLINGKFTTSTLYKYSYNLITDRAGVLTLRNIVVEIDGERIKVPNKNIKIVSKRSEPKNFFLEAELSTKDAYVGQGVSVNYYLYSRKQNIGRTEIEIFPKLNGFIKRFYMPRNERQTVEYDGVVYRRTLEYSAKVFPERKGKLKIDPLRIKFQYTNYRNNGFGSFGLSFGRSKVQSLSSKPVYLNVSDVPAVNVPDDFTTLIDDHEFKININKNKFLVNEAIEVKLEVVGPGALENYSAPELYQDPSLEKFDTKSSVEELSKVVGKKTFEYTFLARGPLNFKEKEITFSFFDSKTKEFKTKTIILPPIIVGGGEVKAQSSKTVVKSDNVSEESKSEPIPKVNLKSVLAPDFTKIETTFSKNWIVNVRNLFLLLILLIIIEGIYKKTVSRNIPLQLLEITNEIEIEGVTYSNLNKYLRAMSYYRDNLDSSLSLASILEKLPISDKCREYFLKNIQITENMEYNQNSKDYKKNFIKRYFKEMNSVFNKNEKNK